jgi:hypothetical protein
MRRMKICVALTLALASACTAHQHHVYQGVMAGATSTLFLFDGAQTTAAVRANGTAVERNPVTSALFGTRPHAAVTWTIAGTQAIGAPMLTQIPNCDNGCEWIMDVLLTGLAAGEGFVVVNNASMRGLPLMSSWR